MFRVGIEPSSTRSVYVKVVELGKCFEVEIPEPLAIPHIFHEKRNIDSGDWRANSGFYVDLGLLGIIVRVLPVPPRRAQTGLGALDLADSQYPGGWSNLDFGDRGVGYFCVICAVVSDRLFHLQLLGMDSEPTDRLTTHRYEHVLVQNSLIWSMHSYK